MRSAAPRLFVVAVLLSPCLKAVAESGPRGLDPHKAITQHSLDVWTTEDGLPANSVMALTQTRDGYLWLGTYDGLARFDGVAFSTFRASSTQGLGGGGVLCLLEDRSGTLWVGTNGGGVSRYEDGLFSSLTTGNGLPNDIVRSLFEDRDGSVWIGTNEGLARWSRGAMVAFGASHGLRGPVVRAIAEDGDGRLWVGTNGGGLMRFAEGRFVPLEADRPLPSQAVFSLLRDRTGSLWIGTNGGGLARLWHDRLTTFSTRDGLPNDIVWSLREDAHGVLWAGTYGGGIARLRGASFEAFSSREGLPSDFVRSICPDREGSLWIGTYNGGLVRLRDGKFLTYTTREGLSHDFARAVLEDRRGTLWVGTTGGGLCGLTDGRFRCYGAAAGLGLDVRALAESPDGSLLVGTAGGGLFRLENGRVHIHPSTSRLPSLNVSAVATEGPDTLWIGTNGGGLARVAGDSLRTFTRHDGLGSDFVMAVLVDRARTVWAGTDGGGVTRLRDGRVETFTRKDGLGSDVVFCLYEDREGALWLGTSGGGISRVKGDTIRTFTTRDGLHDDVVFGIVEDARGDLWLSGNKGVSRLASDEVRALVAGEGRRVRAEAFGTADGMKSGECSGVAQPAAWRARDGRIYFPTSRGIAGIDSARSLRNDLPPPVRIESVVVDERPLPAGAPAVVPPGRERWEFRYTALSFLAPRKVLFKYRLDGYDEDWLPAGTRRTAYYTRVPPGEYTFRVIACNDDGVWNEEGASFRFRVAPRFRDTWPFQASVAGLLLIAGASAYRLRVRALRAHKAELERLVESRTHELLREKERAETARAEAVRHREIAEHADHVKSEVLAIAAHDLKTPLQSILGFADLAAAECESGSPAAEYTGFISGGARRMLGIVESLLDMTALDEGRLVPSWAPVDMGRVAARASEANRASSSRKRQRIALRAEPSAFVEGDELRLVQVLDNLVSNAVKYSPTESSIEVEVFRSVEGICVSVQDRGAGLSETDLAKVFGRFQRLTARPTGGESSTGLGLYIVKRLVELHRGRVWAESDGVGRGARFVVALPALHPTL
jgi:signal transduction histidine kinase/ligand-binding sensor domain-containing protein